ncbi:hypothetical protein [Micrococcoides hystricis]|uniref:Energy-coupling factor transporter transmembrane protein EcfT n=1 Tax=Micrococcoides hystricis TaxID=1572761 RepID=A0ABV6PCA0_9MICC
MIAAIILFHVALGVHQNYWRKPLVRILLTAVISAGSIAVLYLLGGVSFLNAVLLGLAAAAVAVAFGFDKTRIIGALSLVTLLTASLLLEEWLVADSVLVGHVLPLGGSVVPLPLVIASFATFLLLARPTNDLCRSVLLRMRVDDDAQGSSTPEPKSRRGWRLMIGSRALATVHQDDVHEVMQLRGGRFIGPLERWLIVLLAVTDQPTLIAALVAAKGIGRFPELSADRARGAKAEEFLVGSLVSWGFAGLAALLIVVLSS